MVENAKLKIANTNISNIFDYCNQIYSVTLEDAKGHFSTLKCIKRCSRLYLKIRNHVY